MRYKFIGEYEDAQHPINQVLINRGIKDVSKWVAADEENINSPWAFGEEKVRHAIKLMMFAALHDNEIYVLVDCDADGFTSAAIIINYLYTIYKDMPGISPIKDRIHYILHTGKQHGLEDCAEQFPDNCLVILPDSSTNDTEKMRELLNRGCSIVCMDHHEADEYLEDEERLVIINNQICDYPNKDISAAGVVWQVCRAWDQIFETDYSKDLIDLAALGCLSDMMDYRSIETRSIIAHGLRNIKNPFFYYMCEKNKFSIDKMGGINYMSIAFYVTPFINAVVRSGTMEEKDLIFKSMLTMYAFEKIESNKRGHKGELVPRVEEAVRIAANIKARQTKLQDATMDLLEQRIKDLRLTENGIIILLCEPGEVEKNLAGLCANKIQAKYQHPCYILTKSKEQDDKEYFYRGSGRNYSMSENQDLRQLALSTGIPEYVQGHANAHGASIPESRIQEFIDATNKLYENISKEPVYWVDFVWELNKVDPNIILDIADSKDFWGQEVPEPYVAITNIPLDFCNVQLLSPDKNPTIKITLPNNVAIMKFKASEELYEEMLKPNQTITAVCRCNANTWMGHTTAQLIIEDYYLEEKWIF